MFRDFKLSVQSQFEKMSGYPLFRVNVSGDELWELYLKSFPEGINLIFRERTKHDCSACRHFIKKVGNVVAIDENYNVVSMWDVQTVEPYQTVANVLSEKVKGSLVHDGFITKESKIGIDKNRELLPDGTVQVWEHFYIEVPEKYVCRDVGDRLNLIRTGKGVLKRALDEISQESVEIVLELIEQDSLYRGEQYKHILEEFLKLQKEYANLAEDKKENFCWRKAVELPQEVVHIRNTSIGQLLQNISDGMELADAVNAYEKIVAPENYRRPKPIVTRAMIDNAEKELKELGLDKALCRRPATLHDMNVNDILFVDRGVKNLLQGSSIFDELRNEIPQVRGDKNFDKLEEIPIEKFIENILPKVNQIEVLFKEDCIPHLVALTTAQYSDAPVLFKWDNPFCWTYKGDLADSSIKEKVKAAGGKVEGILRASLHWFNKDDLDIHCKDAAGYHICYSDKRSPFTLGELDIDMNVDNPIRGAVENIIWQDERRLKDGVYKVWVKNFRKREDRDVGFEVEIEYKGQTWLFKYPKPLRDEEDVLVAEFEIKNGNLRFLRSLPPTDVIKTEWGLTTGNFYRVNLITLSPNYWNKNIGHKHYFFFLECCKPDKAVRGFFNEYLTDNLNKYKRLFELLGSRMKVEPVDGQLSGLGFAATKRGDLVVRVKGSFNRMLKIKF